MERKRDNPGDGKSRKKSKKMWHRVITVGMFLVILTAAGCGGMALRSQWTAIQARRDFQPDSNARDGTIYPGETQQVEEGSFWVLVNQLPTVEEGSRECSIRYENPAANQYSARISLYLKETGNLLGNTRRVDPGKYVEFLHLKKELPAGEYPVRANLELFEGELPAGTMSLDMVLRVTEKGNSADDSQETGNIGTGTQENDSTVDNERKERQDEGE